MTTDNAPEDENRLRVEVKLIPRDDELRAIYDGLLDGLLIADAETTRFIKTNAAMCQMLGYTEQEILSLSVQDIHPSSVRKEVLRKFEAAAQGRLQTAENVLLLKKSGEALWADVGISLLNYQERLCLVGLFHDITDRKRAEKMLRENEQYMQLALSVSDSYCFSWDIASDTIWRSDSAADVLGIPPETAVQDTGENFFPKVHPEDREILRCRLKGLQPSDGTLKIEYRLQQTAGKMQIMEETAQGIFDGHGGLFRVVGITTDITERKQAEYALNQSKTDLLRAQKVGQIGCWRLDIRENRLEWSDETFRIFGLPKETPLSYDTFLKLVHPADRKYVDAQWQAGLQGESYDIEHRIIVNSRTKWVREKAYLEFDDSGSSLRGGFGIVQDITDRKRMEEILKRSHEELEIRVRERTRELAHAVKKQNEYSEQLRRLAAELTKTEQRERQRLAQVLHDGLQQHLVASIYQLELINSSQNARVEINRLKELINESIEMARVLAAELSPPILLRRDLNSALMWLIDWKRKKHGLDTVLTGDIGSLRLSEEILLLLFESTRELLLNVVKHSGTKKAYVTLQQEDGSILLTVRDDGKGFDPGNILADEHHPKGYGLFQIRERISMMGGNIEVASSPGRGCRTRIIFPLLNETKGTVPESTEGKVAAGTAAGSKAKTQNDEEKMKIRIILADDHTVVRHGLANLISRVPEFEIIGEAANGVEAVDLARKIHPDVVLMDINMPHMDGIEATRIIHGEHKDIHIIGFSMYQEESLKKALLEAGADAYITKQGASGDLIQAIRSCCKAN